MFDFKGLTKEEAVDEVFNMTGDWQYCVSLMELTLEEILIKIKQDLNDSWESIDNWNEVEEDYSDRDNSWDYDWYD